MPARARALESAAVTVTAHGLARRVGTCACSSTMALGATVLFSASVGVSAALLFLVEPMFAKMVLPLLGGSPTVWTTCVVFFQAIMLLGYGYAYAVARRLPLWRQVALHVTLIGAIALTLPLGVPSGWAPPVDGTPIPSLLLMLLMALGAPFFIVSSTAPLLQAWLSRTRHPSARDPYFLYAASNAGSITALLAYPFVVEPGWSLSAQSRGWTLGFIAFAALTLGCGVLAMRLLPPTGGRPSEVGFVAPDERPLGWTQRGRWVALSAVPSSLMLAVTTYLSTDVAAVPLLWTVPLALYLLTFVVAFSSRLSAFRSSALAGMTMLALPLVVVFALDVPGPAWLFIPLHLAALFTCALVLHGELARARPAARRLTEFYVWIAVGGLVGGVFNLLVAPVVFVGVQEYPLAIILACALRPWRRSSGPRFAAKDVVLALACGVIGAATLASIVADLDSVLGGLAALAVVALGASLTTVLYAACAKRPLRLAVGIVLVLVLCSIFVQPRGDLLYAERTFFGVMRVNAGQDGTTHRLFHGTTLHGEQSLSPDQRAEPRTYYHRTGPAGQVFGTLGDRFSRVAVVGLGAGTLAAYAHASQQWTFYELDPAIERIARTPEFFTYLEDCGARCQVVLGDARLSLDRASERFDAIVLDAFSSDAVPTHLLTREAVELYLARLNGDGVLALHVSNRHLDLKPVLGSLADAVGLSAYFQRHIPESTNGDAQPSEWVLMARSDRALGPLLDDARWQRLTARSDRVWTDDYSDLLSVLDRPAFW